MFSIFSVKDFKKNICMNRFTNKCLPSANANDSTNITNSSDNSASTNSSDNSANTNSDPFKVSKLSKINDIFDLPDIKSRIGDLLDCFWCEHGQLINNIKCNILDLDKLEKSAEIYPLSVEIKVTKQECKCSSVLKLKISSQTKIVCETLMYPIPFRNPNVIEVGVDEVGRGCLFGPVTSGAVIWPPNLDNETTRKLIKDSKELTEPQREEAYAYIIENAIGWGVASLCNKEIDRTNILRAAIKTMHMAIDETYIYPEHIIADGNNFNIYTDKKGEPVNHTTIIKGDSKYYSIAAAAIIAKVTRDREMIQLEKDYPELEKYGIGSNKGYGAAVHMEAIKKYGTTDWHRKSFNPCK